MSRSPSTRSRFSIFSGNVSGWLAIGVALSLVAGPRVGGVVAAVATTIKLLRPRVLLAALTDWRGRLMAAVPLAVIVAVSLVLAPQAWVDFAKVLPNTLQFGMASSRTNLSPAHAFFEFGLVGLGTAIGWALTIGFGVAAIATGIREGYSNRVLAMAVFAMVFASSTLSNHLAVMVPLILWAWPAAGAGNGTDGRLRGRRHGPLDPARLRPGIPPGPRCVAGRLQPRR